MYGLFAGLAGLVIIMYFDHQKRTSLVEDKREERRQAQRALQRRDAELRYQAKLERRQEMARQTVS